MARYLTSKEQRSGYRFYTQRIIQAITRRTTLLSASPQSSQAMARSFGLVALGLITVAGLVVGLISPKSSFSAKDKPYISTEDGTQYVLLNGTLHPVTNMVSARLILGQNISPSSVSASSLQDTPKGLLMGIPTGPSVIDPQEGRPSWTVCSTLNPQPSTDIATTNTVSTSVFAGDGIDTSNPLNDDTKAILVQVDNARATRYLLYKGLRTPIDDKDYKAQTNLNVSETDMADAMKVSEAFIDTIPEQPYLTLPFISQVGKTSTAVDQYKVGTILSSQEAAGIERYVVLDTGIEKVSEFVAQLFLSDGSSLYNVESGDIAALPKVSTVDFSNYPDQKPDLIRAKSLCATWSKPDKGSDPKTSIIAKDSLPVSDTVKKQMVDMIPSPNPQVPRANQTWTAPGKAWYAQVSSTLEETDNASQLMIIDDKGVRYFLSPGTDSYDTTLVALGLKGKSPTPIPWSIAKLYGEGPTLSRDAAMVVHESIDTDINQGIVQTEKDKERN